MRVIGRRRKDQPAEVETAKLETMGPAPADHPKPEEWRTEAPHEPPREQPQVGDWLPDSSKDPAERPPAPAREESPGDEPAPLPNRRKKGAAADPPQAEPTAKEAKAKQEVTAPPAHDDPPPLEQVPSTPTPPETVAARHEDLERLQGELTALEDRQHHASEQPRDGLTRDAGERLTDQAKDVEALRDDYERQQDERRHQEARLGTLGEEVERLRQDDAEAAKALEARIEEVRVRGAQTESELRQAVRRQGELVQEMLETDVFPRIAEMDQERWARQEVETAQLREEIAGLRGELAKGHSSPRKPAKAEVEKRGPTLEEIDSRLKLFEGRFLPPEKVFPFPTGGGRRALTTGTRGAVYVLIILAFLAIPLLGVQRSTCGEDQRWSFGVPFKDPAAGCIKRQSGAEVIVDSIA